jgi:hypothetical protein
VTESYDGPKKLLAEALKGDDEFLETLSTLRYLSSSAQKGVPHIPEDYIKHFVEVKTTKDRLISLSDGKSEYSAKAAELLKLWWAPEH